MLELMAPDFGAVVVEDHATGARRALVDRGDEVGQRAAPLLTAQSSIMDYMPSEIVDIDRMPRGGPDASCVDRLLETDRLEYLDRDSDGDAAMKRASAA